MNEAESRLVAALHLKGASISELARFFGVSRSTVSRRLAKYLPADTLVFEGRVYAVQDGVVVSQQAKVKGPKKQKKVKGKTAKITVSEDTRSTFLYEVSNQLGLYPEDIDTSKSFAETGADSLDSVEIVMALEDAFNIAIPDHLAEEFGYGSLEDALVALHKELTGKASKADDVVEVTEPEAPVALNYLVTPLALVVVRDGSPLTIMKDHKNFDKILVALKEQDSKKVFELIDLKETVKKWSNGRVLVDASGAVLDGNELPVKLTDRLLALLEEGDTNGLDSLAKFIENTYENDRADVVDRLYDFLQATDIEIDEDGYVIAFKSVEADYLDSYTKTIDNSPGKLVSMPRARVNADQSATCVAGLHVMSRRYFGVYSERGNRIVRVRVHPADFVAIPRDYEGKARTCRYVVLDDVTESFYPSSEE